MKNYIGTKEIKAKPMTRGEYSEYKGWKLPEDENGADEGYLKDDGNGHEQWDPKDVFERDFKLADSWKDRVEIESADLDKKIEALSKALAENKVPKNSRMQLQTQLSVMKKYQQILKTRLQQ